MNAITLDHISKSFQDKQVLKQISLRVEEGEIIGLLGPSGAGKTTILNILTSQLLPDKGKATLLGCDCANLNDEIFRRIGLVLDNCGLYERLNSYDNLALFADIHHVKHERIQKVLEVVGLSDDIHTPVNRLSKGMKQRLLFARAILHQPSILFLDEPTTGLDPASTQRIHNMIMKMKEQGTTIFLTTHHMEEASKLCDHVALLNEGNIVAYGSPKELCHTYKENDVFFIELKNGECIEMPNRRENSEHLAKLMNEQMIVSIHTGEPTLEDVFLSLTGRGLS